MSPESGEVNQTEREIVLVSSDVPTKRGSQKWSWLDCGICGALVGGWMSASLALPLDILLVADKIFDIPLDKLIKSHGAEVAVLGMYSGLIAGFLLGAFPSTRGLMMRTGGWYGKRIDWLVDGIRNK